MKETIEMQSMDQLLTPCYIVDQVKFIDNVNVIKRAFCSQWEKNPILGYSIKTNNYPELVLMARHEGMFAEVVSDDEYRLAISLGYIPPNIIFNGPQKSETLLLDALRDNAWVNLDNFEEIEIIKRNILSLPANHLRIGLRVNFDLEQCCPGETTAGTEVSRFGFCVENGDLEQAISELKAIGISISGLHMHYSSKTRSVKVFRALSEKACNLVKEYSLNESLSYIDIGGGFFLGQTENTAGKPNMNEYAKCICEVWQDVVDKKKVDLILEPGAALIATSVSYMTQIINARDIRGRNVLTTDGSLLHINPFMEPRNPIAEIIRRDAKNSNTIEEQIICGATCMENDRLLKLKDEALVMPGDRVVFQCAGAYTMVFNNCFINLPPYVYIKSGDNYNLVRDKCDKTLELM